MTSRRLREHEQGVLARVLAGLGRWLSGARELVLAPARRVGSLPNPTALYSTADQWAQEVRQLRPELMTAARIGWSEAFGRPTFSSTSSHVLGALAASENFLANLPDEVHRMAVQTISDGLSAGHSQQQITEAVQLLLSVTGSSTFQGRAAMITGTEVTRAANAGAFAAALEAEPQLGVIFKQWNDVGDDRVRRSHELADDTQIPLARAFIVGGFPMMYPGDPAGPPWEVINCRCDLSFTVQEGR